MGVTSRLESEEPRTRRRGERSPHLFQGRLLRAMRAPGCKFCLFLLVLAELRDCLCAGDGDALSLCYKFTITPKGQPWCEILGYVNEKTFLNDTCESEKFIFISDPGMKVNEIEAWNQQKDTLKDVVEELKKILLDTEAENIATRGPLSLQSSMMCKQESNGHTSASWEFGFNGQIFLRFDSINKRWTELHRECGLLKKALDSDRDLLVRTSTGDCVYWLQHVSGPHGEVLDTKAAPTTSPATYTATPTTPRTTTKTEANTIKPISWVLPLVVTSIAVFGVLCFLIYRRRCSRGSESVV